MAQPGDLRAALQRPPARDRRGDRHRGRDLRAAGRCAGDCLCRPAAGPASRLPSWTRLIPPFLAAGSGHTLILKRSARGATILAAGTPPVDVAGFPVTVLNTVGAGDAFAGGLIYGRCQGWEWQASVRLANACGAIVVTRHGCAAAMPRLAEVEAFMGAPNSLNLQVSESRLRDWRLRDWEIGDCSIRSGGDMEHLMRPVGAAGETMVVTPQSAGWQYLSFRVVALAAGGEVHRGHRRRRGGARAVARRRRTDS